ncbi:hypothetical protein BQ8794_210117 [Mesorhizobium prunaredense]|uniref:Uncharacterized protein n=1 Tax=Mesorhizobium prunaredense TaxID=1631249 RepID=A0A1R3V676_9HYPH|nr:hypothetical protein BQ8794_210117 [Mesorhizobium prunaredense]
MQERNGKERSTTEQESDQKGCEVAHLGFLPLLLSSVAFVKYIIACLVHALRRELGLPRLKVAPHLTPTPACRRCRKGAAGTLLLCQPPM